MTQVDLFGDRTERRSMGSHQNRWGGSDEWLTPPEVIGALGAFDLDPCSPGDRRPWDTATTHYDASQNGLRQPWSGRVWLNPPYADSAPWLARLVEHGHGTALVFARTETRMWFDHIWPKATALLFLRGRLTFRTVTGDRAKANAGAPSALVAYGPGDAAALRACAIPGAYVETGTRT